MKLTDQQLKKLKNLAKSTKGSFLIEYFELVKNDVADVRSKLEVPNDMQVHVRKGICDALDSLIIDPLQRYANEQEAPVDSWN